MLKHRRKTASHVRVDDDGVFAVSRREVILDVLFDGRRVWSFWLFRDGEPQGRGHLVRWPKALRGFLDGTARVSVTAHDGGEALFDDEVRFGKGEGRVAITTADGRPIALDKSLRRVQTFDSKTPDAVEPLMRAIDDVLRALRAAGVEGFLAYGTLLGAIRSGKLIGHDSDADLGYLSRYEHPVDVSRESFRLQRALTDLGYSVTRYSTAAFKVDVREPDGSIRGLDVFAGFMMMGRLHLMGEIRTKFKREWIEPLGTAELEGWTFPVPADPDRVLAAAYGKQWRVPDPAFHFTTPTSTHRRFNGWFRGIRKGRSRWDRVYAARPAPAEEPSAFARQVLAKEPDTPQIVDLGCGAGGDVLWYARSGFETYGLDLVPRAFERAAAIAEAEQLPARFVALNLLDIRSLLATSALVAATPQPRTVVARHVVDAIHPQARRELWRASRLMLSNGGRLYLEFLVRVGDDGYDRAVRARRRGVRKVAREVREQGGTIVSRKVRAVSFGEQTSTPSKVCWMVIEWER